VNELRRGIRGLLAYTIWADRQTLEDVDALDPQDLTRDTGVSHGSILGTMAHILGAEQLWLSRLLGVSLDRLPSIEDFPTLSILRTSWEDFWPQLEFYMAALTEAQFASDLTWTEFDGEERTLPLAQVLLHFVNHASYHRGQVAGQLRQLGHPARSTDLVDWRGFP